VGTTENFREREREIRFSAAIEVISELGEGRLLHFVAEELLQEAERSLQRLRYLFE
jgi:hypothetical protein